MGETHWVFATFLWLYFWVLLIMPSQQILFVTGKLAESALRCVAGEVGSRVGFKWTVEVLPITVAALLTTEWIAKKLPQIPPVDRVILPGYVRGDLQLLAALWQVPVELGPKDLRRLAEHFGLKAKRDERYGQHDIQIIAEINHAPRMSPEVLLQTAQQLASDGADLIDLGCDPGSRWLQVGDAVRRLRDLGIRVSIDSLEPSEITDAVAAGAELVLSLNHSNRFLASELDVEWVVIPDEPNDLVGLEETLRAVDDAGGRLRIDPILEPIGLGFAASLGRYLEVRRRWPEAEIMMGIGNLTELTDVDSAGVNTMLLGFCQEVGIRSVLTTQVVSWAQSAVRECDLARRLVHYAVQARVPPKRVDSRLVMLRDPATVAIDSSELSRLASQLKDSNYRIFVAEGKLHVVAAGVHLQASDPFELFDALMATKPKNIDASHAFYLGYELSKAATAATLGKEYQQDEALNWGFLTRDEQDRHRLSRRREAASAGGESLDE